MNKKRHATIPRPAGRGSRPLDPLVFAVLETAAILQQRLDEALKAIGLSRAKMEALHQLAQAGEPVPLRTLAAGQRCVPSNMTTLMDRLESDGLVRRVDDPTDRRRVRAELTARGMERARAGAAAVAQVERDVAASLPAAERTTLHQMLHTLRR